MATKTKRAEYYSVHTKFGSAICIQVRNLVTGSETVINLPYDVDNYDITITPKSQVTEEADHD